MNRIKRLTLYLILAFVFSSLSSCYYEDGRSNRMEGSGSIHLSGEVRRVDFSVSGSGNITYKGRPRVNSSIPGSGNIRSR